MTSLGKVRMDGGENGGGNVLGGPLGGHVGWREKWVRRHWASSITNIITVIVSYSARSNLPFIFLKWAQHIPRS